MVNNKCKKVQTIRCDIADHWARVGWGFDQYGRKLDKEEEGHKIYII